MRARWDDLQVSDVQIERGWVTVAEFAGAVALDMARYSRTHLFVDPAYWGCGIGARLLLGARSQIAQPGAERLKVQLEQNAAQFYVAQGGQRLAPKPRRAFQAVSCAVSSLRKAETSTKRSGQRAVNSAMSVGL